MENLNKLKGLENNGLKVNKSELARRLGVDRRTVSKYISGYTKSTSRKRSSKIDQYHDIIEELLNDNYKVFAYKEYFGNILKITTIDCAQSSFRRYISSIGGDHYFKERRKQSKLLHLQDLKQVLENKAQLDWKETLTFILNTGEVVIINIFCLILSYSRFRVYRLSLTKTQDILFHFLR